jgi:hypothetical protein
VASAAERGVTTDATPGTVQPRLPYQYVVLRCVPRVEREEFLNIGVVLFCQRRDFLRVAADASSTRLSAVSPDLDVDGVRAALAGVEAVCSGDDVVGEHLGRTLGQRFGWLAAPRSTVVQPGPVHGGVTTDPARELDRLVELLVS